MRACSLRPRGRIPIPGKLSQQYLPWLAQEHWYQQARRGYARGWEPVRFVEQVRGFLAVLEWYGDGTVNGALLPPNPTLPPRELAR